LEADRREAHAAKGTNVNRSLRQPAGAVKPSPGAAILRLWVRPIPFNQFETWGSVTVLAEGAWGSVLGIRLDHPEALATLTALRLIDPTARRVDR